VAITQIYVNPAINGNSGTGTIGDPYGDLQYALNTITRNTTDGDQINIKAGTAEVLAAALTLATYGTPSRSAKLTFRGYASAAGDGGVGVINCAGAYALFAATYSNFILLDLRVTAAGAAEIVTMGTESAVIRCEIDTTTGIGLRLSTGSQALNCYVHDCGSYSVVVAGNGSVAQGNYIVSAAAAGLYLVASGIVIGNIVKCADSSNGLQDTGYSAPVCANNVLFAAAGTGKGISIGDNGGGSYINNIVVGFSGAGGVGILSHANSAVALLGYNAFYNNTTPQSLAGVSSMTGGDVTLAADPFTDAANGDFSLTAAAKTALRSLGWPASYLGAHANTNPHVTIGPMQYGPTPAAGGGLMVNPGLSGGLR
jgi:hypothetical protein